jgi:hypothetical protein
MGTTGVEGGDVDGIGGVSDNGVEMLSKEAAMEGIGTMGEEVTGSQAVGTVVDNGSDFGIV